MMVSRGKKRLLRTSQGTLPLLPSGPGGVQALRLRSSSGVVAAFVVVGNVDSSARVSGSLVALSRASQKKSPPEGGLDQDRNQPRLIAALQRLIASRRVILLRDFSARAEIFTRTQRPVSTS